MDMGEKGNLVDTANLAGIGSGVASTGLVGSLGEDDTAAGGQGVGAPAGAAKLAAQQMHEQLTDQAGHRTGVQGLLPGADKPSGDR